MKVRFYLQISQSGKVHATNRYPNQPIPGAALTRVTLEVDDKIFRPLEAQGTVAAGDARIVPLVITAEGEETA